MQAGKYNHSPSPLSSLLLGAVTMSAILLAALPGGNLINLGLSVAFVCVVIVSAIAGKRALWFSPEILILVAWLSFSMIGTLFAVDTNAAMFKSLTMVQVLVLAFCVQQVIIWNRGNSANLLVYGIAVAISYLLTFTGISAQDIAGAEDVAGDVARVASTLSDENTFGAVSLMGFVFVLICLAKNTNRTAFMPLGILLVLLFIAVINSGSRTAFLGAFLVLFGAVWAFRLWRGVVFSKFLFFSSFALVASALVFLIAQNTDSVQERIEAVFSEDSRISSRVEDFINVLVSGDTKAESGESIDSRVEMIAAGLDIVTDSPFVGVGLDNFRTVSGAGTYAHSNLIEIAVSTGLVGLVLYYLMYLVLVFRVVKLKKMDGDIGTIARLSLVGLVAYFLMDITRVSYYEKTSWLYFSVLGAFIEVLARENTNKYSAKKRKRRRRVKGNGAEDFSDIDALNVGFSSIDKEGSNPKAS